MQNNHPEWLTDVLHQFHYERPTPGSCKHHAERQNTAKPDAGGGAYDDGL